MTTTQALGPQVSKPTTRATTAVAQFLTCRAEVRNRDGINLFFLA